MVNSDMDLYERYHNDRKIQRRILKEKNFTYRFLIKILEGKLSDVKRVLDIGCGTGTIDFYLASKGIEVVGVDISKHAIQNAKRNAEIFGFVKNTKFYVSNFPKANIKGTFDLVICSEVLEHIKEDQRALRKIYKLLSPVGIGLFSSPSVNSLFNKLGLTKQFDKDVGHLRRYDTATFSKIIHKAGFKITNIEKKQGLLRDALFIFPFGSLFIRLANRFSIISDILTILDNLLLPLGEAQIIIIAKK